MLSLTRWLSAKWHEVQTVFQQICLQQANSQCELCMLRAITHMRNSILIVVVFNSYRIKCKTQTVSGFERNFFAPSTRGATIPVQMMR